MSDLYQRIEAIKNKLNLRRPEYTFIRKPGEKSGDPDNWVLRIGEKNEPQTLFVAPTMDECVDLAEQHIGCIGNAYSI